MVFVERYVTDVLTSQFGHFVEGLDRNQLRLSALWRGEVSLQNVRLRRQALDSLMADKALPVEIAHGRVGTLQLRIPWHVVLQLVGQKKQAPVTRGSASPSKRKSLAPKKKGGVSIVLKDVHVLVVPKRKRPRTDDTKQTEINTEVTAEKTDAASDGEDDETITRDSPTKHREDDETKTQDSPTMHPEEIAWIAKEKEAQAALDKELLKAATNSSNATITSTTSQQQQTNGPNQGTDPLNTSSSSSWQYWFQERLARLLETLTVTVENFHVRYEDPGSALGFVWNNDEEPSISQKLRPSFCVGLTLKEFTIHSIQPVTDSSTQSNSEMEKNEGRTENPSGSGYDTRYKRAAATDLAVYWNSGTPIMSELKESLGGDSFYEEAFLAFQNRSNKGRGDGLSEAARQSLFGLFPSRKHEDINSYVLDPFSPSITFAVVHPNNAEQHLQATIPPSTIEGKLPPCRFTLSRTLLEDLSYMRKSLSLWEKSQQYAHLNAIVQKRPTVSVMMDPAAWWRYAGEAVLAIGREEFPQGSNHQKLQGETTFPVLRTSSTHHGNESSKPQFCSLEPHRRRGWRAMACAILARKQYRSLYEEFLTNNQNESIHEKIVQMERQELSIEEIVAFRLHVAREISATLFPSPVKSRVDFGEDSSVMSSVTEGSASAEDPVVLEVESSKDVISADHRYLMFVELKQTLVATETGKFSLDDGEEASINSSVPSTNVAASVASTIEKPFGLENPRNRVSWKSYVSCSEVSLQINDKRIKKRHRDLPSPVVRLEFAFLQEQQFFLDGSWEASLSVGSFHVEDLAAKADTSPFQLLVGPKESFASRTQDSFCIDGLNHQLSGSLKIRRSQGAFRNVERGSTTWTDINVLPLEICYSTAPVEALSRIFDVANLDFASDYQRLSAKLYDWRERQRRRLFAALSHKQKSIFVNVNVGAPTILLPDNDSLLIIDLGRLKFSNEENRRSSEAIDYDDHWRFEIASIQVQCDTIRNYKSYNQRLTLDSIELDPTGRTAQQLIEPFSLIFLISTKVHEHDGGQKQQILVNATLPRLVINVTTSAIRLISYLEKQWRDRQMELRSSLLLPTRVLGRLAGQAPRDRAKFSNDTRSVELNFVAPLLRFKVENDVDGRDCKGDYGRSTPIVDFSLRGIESTWLSTTDPSGRTTIDAEAKLRGIDAVDLYQGAGDDFSLLISSIAPESIQNKKDPTDRYTNSTVTDLVRIAYESVIENPDFRRQSSVNITSHELFVEWNAETIAAFNKAISFPEGGHEGDDAKSQGSDVFFDAEEDDFYDAGSVLSDESSSDTSFDLSEIHSRSASHTDLVEMSAMPQVFLGSGGQSPRCKLSIVPYSSTQPWLSTLTSPKKDSHQDFPVASFKMSFGLSKLRINFNKESRHRRIVSAEMDRTSVEFAVRPTGGYTASVTLGNFILSDCDSLENKTLYREIVGLKTDVPLDHGKQTSLLEMSIVKNPRTRQYTRSRITDKESGGFVDESVLIDVSNANVRGCDIFFSAKFSPMRFVYLQQLWFEVVDYFFEGITGYEVWGNKRPTSLPESQLQFAPSNAHSFGFTRFDVFLEAPVIIIPVSYCSTDYLRVEAKSITVGNKYDFRPLRIENPNDGGAKTNNLQWFNNCFVDIDGISLLSWSGRNLNSPEEPFAAKIGLSWPSGPTAILNKPKWKVDCQLEDLRVSLLREDYALVQHIVSHNFGEGSRHWDEWEALQSLPPFVFKSFKNDTMVHFGYDKKDVTPTTFDVHLFLPCISVSLVTSNHQEIALVHCFELKWHYWKHSDLVSRQKINCQINLQRKESEVYAAMLSGQNLGIDSDQEFKRPSVEYRSSSRPTGFVERVLEIEHASIHIGLMPWGTAADFFVSLPPPSYTSPDQVIQVGDRWYKIGEGSSGPQKSRESRELTWISAQWRPVVTKTNTPGPVRSTSFRLFFKNPEIAVESKDMAVVLGMESAEYYSSERHAKIEKDAALKEVRLITRYPEKDQGNKFASLFELDRLVARHRSCSAGENCSCSAHTSLLEIGNLRSKALFSDLNVTCEVMMKLSSDFLVRRKSQKKASLDARDKSASKISVQRYATSDSVQLRCREVSITIVDDSLRHFASSQDVIGAVLADISFDRRQAPTIPSSSSSIIEMEDVMEASIQEIQIIDHLQSELSPYRSAFVAKDVVQLDFMSLPTRAHRSFASSTRPHALYMSRKKDNETCRYELDVRQVALQYNPTMVIALQRFMGRLRKRVQTAYSRFQSTTNSDSSPQISTAPTERSSVCILNARLESFALSLNKEHRDRRLAEVSVQTIEVNASRSNEVAEASITVEDLKVFDSDSKEISDKNRFLLKVSDMSGPFLDVKLLSCAKSADESSPLPDWARAITQDQEADDLIQITIGGLDVVFLPGRTSELADYFKNALPGKSMGISAPISKASVPKKSRNTRLFKLFSERSNVYIPRKDIANDGVVISFETLLRGYSNLDSSTNVETSIFEISFGIYGQNGATFEGSRIMDNFEIMAQGEMLGDKTLKLKCGLSDLQARISYTNYVHLLAVADYLASPVEKSKWHNMDYDWEHEEGDQENQVVSTKTPLDDYPTFSRDVEYGPNARYIRFGEPSSNGHAGPVAPIEVSVFLNDLAVVLRRNDRFPERDVVDYDMVLFRGENFEFSYASSQSGISAVFSAGRIFVFDLGEQGRLLRATSVSDPRDAEPMPIAVLAEGYSSSEETEGLGEQEAQLLLNLDAPSNAAEGTNVRFVVNRLNMRALFRPLQDVSEFLLKRWETPPFQTYEGEQQIQKQSSLPNEASTGNSNDGKGRPLSLHLVFQYPQFMFVADEGDPHSRALILRGLALVNASKGHTDENDGGIISSISVNADFQNISSYIVPDVSNSLFAKDSYRIHIEDALMDTGSYIFHEETNDDARSSAGHEQGLSLLLPVTFSFDFNQVSKNTVLTERMIAVNMEPVSVMISEEDLQLVRGIAQRWSLGPVGKPPKYEVSFVSSRLGIGLQKVGNMVVVDAVHDQTIEIGDSLIAINGTDLNLSDTTPLSEVVEQLQNEPRPLTLTFLRTTSFRDGNTSSQHTDLKKKDNFTESLDISLSQASLTLVGEVPMFRSAISNVRLSAKKVEGQNLQRHLSLSSAASIDYYNLRIWEWEPFLEQGSFKLNADVSAPLEGSRTITIEASDAVSAPISLNITDACISATKRLLDWDVSFDDIDGDIFIDEARKAANAALRFARQQKHTGAKPFLLQNDCGVSCAFVVQKKGATRKSSSDSTFVLVGDYDGLQEYDPSDISEVQAGGECKFRLSRDSRHSDGRGKVPSLTLAFQSLSGIILEPLVDLQIVSSGVTLLPLSYTTDGTTASRQIWVSWTVDLREEMTVLKISSAFRVTSNLQTLLELGLDPVDGKASTRSLGVLPANGDFFLPLWLVIKPSFTLSIRSVGSHHYSTLFALDGSKRLHWDRPREVNYVECQARNSLPMWLAASLDGDMTSTSITIDCVVTLTNMLPVGIDWEVSKSKNDDHSIDSSTLRREKLGAGKSAEIMSDDDPLIYMRIRGSQWSHYFPLEIFDLEEDFHHVIRLEDDFGVPLNIGARISSKNVGIRVVLFAELWFLNATSLDIAFGASSESIKGRKAEASEGQANEISAAEAALKEFSSLFESGESGKDFRRKNDEEGERTLDILLLPSNSGSVVVEECFEYIEVKDSCIERRWWGSSDPLSPLPNLTLIEKDGDDWSWIDDSWLVDISGGAVEGWETAKSILSFSTKRLFKAKHRYRRRRWYRRKAASKSYVNAFFQRPSFNKVQDDVEDGQGHKTVASFQIGVQVNQGAWSMMSKVPAEGVVYGAVRASSARWKDLSSTPASTYELCYDVSPVEGAWGIFSRLLTVSSRFIFRNDSRSLSFEIKQAGTTDSSAIVVAAGEIAPFHWTNHLLPELITVRPVVHADGAPFYRWSGGFDPLTIGVVPLRMRRNPSFAKYSSSVSYEKRIRSLRFEAKIRPNTGRTGINLSLEEEDERGDGCLFRIDNCSYFPIWVTQDGVLANPSRRDPLDDSANGDFLGPNQRMPFALDVPFRQGKYSHRNAATLEELLRVRIGLGPLNSRSGIETTRVLSLIQIGSTIRLNPSKITLLSQKQKNALSQVRIIGIVTNDGPTRVLRLGMMTKEESLFSNPFSDEFTVETEAAIAQQAKDDNDSRIVECAENAISVLEENPQSFPAQDEALRAILDVSKAYTSREVSRLSKGVEDSGMIVSFRMSLNGFMISLVDSSPGEIAVVTLKNLNALASWNTDRTSDSTVYITVAHFQVDNMLPNSPYPVAIAPDFTSGRDSDEALGETTAAPLLVVGLSFGPKHKSGITILKSVTVAPRNLAIRVDLAFLVRLQNFMRTIQRQFSTDRQDEELFLPNLDKRLDSLRAAAMSGLNSQRLYFGGLTILPCAIKLSVAPAKALTPAQDALEGEANAAIHRAIRKGDVRLGDSDALLGVKIGHRNATPQAVMRGVVKSIVVDSLLRLDGASLTFAGVALQNHIATGPQLGSILGAHYLASLRHNVPALLGSMSALGNPVGLVRGLGDGVSDFVLEPVKGFQRSVQEMDASHLVDGVAKGTLSLARHTVGGFADSAAALAETFSKNMAVLTLDRRYAQKRDRKDDLREADQINVALGFGSGVQKLVHGFLEGVTGVVKAPMRGAEKRGFEGFAKGIGKGLLGLLVKPIIGISDGITDVMIGVKGAVDHGSGGVTTLKQVRPRRALYGLDRAIRRYSLADAAASALMMNTRLAGELYMSHLDMGDFVAIFSVKRMVMLSPRGQEVLVLKYKHIESLETRPIDLADGSPGWGIIVILNTPRRNGSEVEVIACKQKTQADQIVKSLESGKRNITGDLEIQAEQPGESTSSAPQP